MKHKVIQSNVPINGRIYSEDTLKSQIGKTVPVVKYFKTDEPIGKATMVSQTEANIEITDKDVIENLMDGSLVTVSAGTGNIEEKDGLMYVKDYDLSMVSIIRKENSALPYHGNNDAEKLKMLSEKLKQQTEL